MTATSVKRREAGFEPEMDATQCRSAVFTRRIASPLTATASCESIVYQLSTTSVSHDAAAGHRATSSPSHQWQAGERGPRRCALKAGALCRPGAGYALALPALLRPPRRLVYRREVRRRQPSVLSDARDSIKLNEWECRCACQPSVGRAAGRRRRMHRASLHRAC